MKELREYLQEELTQDEVGQLAVGINAKIRELELQIVLGKQALSDDVSDNVKKFERKQLAENEQKLLYFKSLQQKLFRIHKFNDFSKKD